MDPNRKRWNETHKALRHALDNDPARAVDLFLTVHGMVHAAEMTETELFSFQDEVIEGMDKAAMRRIPEKESHSVAWELWHLARIEDVTMNLLVAGAPQRLHLDGWMARLGLDAENAAYISTGNGMDAVAVADLSATVDLDGLLAYRLAVGRRTREVVRQIPPRALHESVDPARLQRIWDTGAMLPQGQGIVDYWSRRTIAGLLLMPPTRHCMLHLSKARRIKKRRE
jgi:hypothetical protein